jgi:lysophospholipase L1-like esterase
MKKTIILLAGVALLGACRKSQFDEVERTQGNADFTRYVAVGNSLTQGISDGGLYADGQENNYPSMIAQQMALVNGDMGDFLQPTVYGNGSGYIHLEYIDGELEVVQAGDVGGYTEDATWASWGGQGLPYNNLGIAGITLEQCVALDDVDLLVSNAVLGGIEITFPIAYSVPGNPYARFLDFGESPFLGGTPIQYLDHIRNSNATFFTCWLGSNDVLGYATSGGDQQTIAIPLVGDYTFQGLADPVEFRMRYDSVLTAFNQMGAKGVCATIPDVTTIPYFNTFTVQSLKDDYGYTDVWIEEWDLASSTGTVRVATDEDLILITAADTIELGCGGSETNYLQHTYVLDAGEVAATRTVTLSVNAEIAASAAQFGFGVVDIHSTLETLKAGVTYEGIDITPAYIEGAGFSLDGIHLTPRGYAVVANEFIEVINNTYESNIPKLSIGNYRGIVFP